METTEVGPGEAVVSKQQRGVRTLAIRFDKVRDATFKVIKEWLDTVSDKYFLYEEEGSTTGKVHWQGVVDLDLSHKNIDAWRKNLKDKLDPLLKNQHSLALMKKETYKAYCTKDGKRAAMKGYTEDELSNYEDESYKKDDKKSSIHDELYVFALDVASRQKDPFVTQRDYRGSYHEVHPDVRIAIVQEAMRIHAAIKRPYDYNSLAKVCRLCEDRLYAHIKGKQNPTTVNAIIEILRK